MNHSHLLTGPGGDSVSRRADDEKGGHQHRGCVTLNVGGTAFQTRKEALLRHPGTRLGESNGALSLRLVLVLYEYVCRAHISLRFEPTGSASTLVRLILAPSARCVDAEGGAFARPDLSRPVVSLEEEHCLEGAGGQDLREARRRKQRLAPRSASRLVWPTLVRKRLHYSALRTCIALVARRSPGSHEHQHAKHARVRAADVALHHVRPLPVCPSLPHSRYTVLSGRTNTVDTEIFLNSGFRGKR